MRDAILSVLSATYGESIYIDILADEIVKIVEGEPEFREHYERHEQIRLRIWDFFSGGDTADHAATRIQERLEEAGAW